MRAGKWKSSTVKDYPGPESMGYRFNQYPRKVYQLTAATKFCQLVRMRTLWRARVFPGGFVFWAGLSALLSVVCAELWMVLHVECKPMQTLTRPDLVVGPFNPRRLFTSTTTA
jgi:hypothetical protein